LALLCSSPRFLDMWQKCHCLCAFFMHHFLPTPAPSTQSLFPPIFLHLCTHTLVNPHFEHAEILRWPSPTRHLPFPVPPSPPATARTPRCRCYGAPAGPPGDWYGQPQHHRLYKTTYQRPLPHFRRRLAGTAPSTSNRSTTCGLHSLPQNLIVLRELAPKGALKKKSGLYC
jgi:hypothetical protein